MPTDRSTRWDATPSPIQTSTVTYISNGVREPLVSLYGPRRERTVKGHTGP